MPFCPKCRCEYREGFTVCSDCGEKLVSYLPADEKSGEQGEKSDNINWIPIARLTSHQYAEMVVEGLRSKDIPAIVRSGTGHFGITGQMGNFTFRPIGGGYVVMVAEEKVGDALIEAEIILGDEWERSNLIEVDE